MKSLAVSIKLSIFATAKGHGALSERLGTGLQNRLRRFDSATHLNDRKSIKHFYGFFIDSMKRKFPTI